MADDVDMASQIEAEAVARGIAAARQPIANGIPGDCQECGDESERIVRGRCATCRDRSALLLKRLGQ